MKEGEGRSLSGACVSFYRGRMEVVVEVAGRGGGLVVWAGAPPLLLGDKADCFRISDQKQPQRVSRAPVC